MLTFIVIIVLILQLINLPLVIKVSGHVDLFDNDGFFKLSFFSIPLIKGKIYFSQSDITHNNVIIQIGKKKNEIHLIADKNDKQSILTLLKEPIFYTMRLKSVDIDTKIGKSDDAFFTTLLMGAVKVGFYSVLAAVKSKTDASIREHFTPQYNADIFEIDFLSIINLSITNIIYGIYLTIKNKLKQNKTGGKLIDSRA